MRIPVAAKAVLAPRTAPPRAAGGCPVCGASTEGGVYCSECWERHADTDVLVARHRRHWAEVKRRRERYGYGPLGRVRAWWAGRKRPPATKR